MNFIRSSSLHDAFSDRAARLPLEIDLSPDEWEEVERDNPPADQRLELSTIASFWAIAVMLLLVIVAAPAFEAAAHYLQ
ncbi:MAG TPA: hypothetical protein VMI56_00490 [Reyranella sp.]|nr:hypothetical protein [Reyranella sp.]HTY68757.1 hypothetical protein [Alphaproteobacteria bacterium]